MRLPTGGSLNRLNEKFGLNKRQNSVPVMQLVRNHAPRTPRELKELIEAHYDPSPCPTRCTCGVVSQGTVEAFSLNLFKAQFSDADFLKTSGRQSYARCYEFQYNLFCVSPLRGDNQEVKSRSLVLDGVLKLQLDEGQKRDFECDEKCCHARPDEAVQKRKEEEGGPHARMSSEHGHISARAATEEEDCSFGIDYVVCVGGEPRVGIQVKPSTCVFMHDVMQSNSKKQRSVHYPTLTHVYCTETLKFDDADTRALVKNVLSACRA